MGLFTKSKEKNQIVDINLLEALTGSLQEFNIRSLAFNVCLSMISNAIARCDFVSYQSGKPKDDYEAWLWNHEPNANENSTEFLHHLIYRLLIDNEVLVVNGRKSAHGETLCVADSFDSPDDSPMKENVYSSVVCGSHSFNSSFREKDVLHFKLNHLNLKPVLDGISTSYGRLVKIAAAAFSYSNGRRIKVHVDSIASNVDGFQEAFPKMLSQQLKPFFEGENSVLPEFDGYTYSDFVGANGSSVKPADIAALIEEIFTLTSRAFLVPDVLISGKVEATEDAYKRFLTDCIDPICYQLQEEITRKRYGFERWSKGEYLRVDSSSLIHFDMFANAANVERLIGSGCYTVNDIKRATGQPVIKAPWADEYYLTKNIGLVDTLKA